MIKIMFVCHGNICRSPMAEFVMKDLVRRAGLEKEIVVASAACRRDEIGADTYLGTREKLDEMGIPYEKRRARQITSDDYERYDFIVAMDEENMRDLARMTQGDPAKKTRLLMDFAGEHRGVADPWYTGDFDATFRDVKAGCDAILKELQKRGRTP
ncbi:MAG: low molecular weight phosphotyrosine protein phosphatase [Schwartzia sp.]|nr:low molecular weight phosphotyrosine protein phosphatase [Schwartzia sp. (in: firmicutes)]